MENDEDKSNYLTPYERGNLNQTTTWKECIAFYASLAEAFPHILSFDIIGESDCGTPIHAGIVTADGIFDQLQILQAKRPIFFNNNGIHPGEPEGIDNCMAVVRDFCLLPAKLASLGSTVFLFIPVYNVDGCLNRQNTSRANQVGPEQFGFRGNDLHMDLNRDFLKTDTLCAQTFNRFFSAWSPDVMVDTHTSNGADYQYTMTLIQTQAVKLGGGGLSEFYKSTMLPYIYTSMSERGWPICPAVSPVKVIPDDGIVDFLETPRFSTGYAALHHTIGFMAETHMLKPYCDRYNSMRVLVDTILEFTVANGLEIRRLRDAARALVCVADTLPIHWTMEDRASKFLFKGFEAHYFPSKLGSYSRLAYDRSRPFEREIDYFDNFVVDGLVSRPVGYLIPHAWRSVLKRLRLNGVVMVELQSSHEVSCEC